MAEERLKHPLSIFIVWHPDFLQGREIADFLYSVFCRDIDDPLSRGLGIPIYYRWVSVEKTPISIDTSQATRNAIVLLIDENYIIDDNFREYTNALIGCQNASTRLFPVALSENATGYGDELAELQFLRAYNGDLSVPENIRSSKNRIKIELLHDCARLLMNFQPTSEDTEESKNNSPVILFLSHAKKDGLEIAKKFKAFVDAELKLDVFFDTVDIADGYEFESQIETNIKKSALIVFHTDEYSAREWCRIEVLIAKRNKSSIVVVHDIKHGEKRAFPYLGNTPTIALQDDGDESFNEIVSLTLYQVINNVFQLELLESFNKRFPIEEAEYISISSPPELFNYIDIYKKKAQTKHELIVLYPEPPLGAEELRILNEIDKDIKFITPIHLPGLVKS